MNIQLAQAFQGVVNLGASSKRKTEMAVAISISKRLPLPAPAQTCDFNNPGMITIDKISFERMAAQNSIIDKLSAINEITPIDREAVMSIACSLWCARARVAYPMASSYVSDVFSGPDLFDRVFNYSSYLPKDTLGLFSESANEIIPLSNHISAVL